MVGAVKLNRNRNLRCSAATGPTEPNRVFPGVLKQYANEMGALLQAPLATLSARAARAARWSDLTRSLFKGPAAIAQLALRESWRVACRLPLLSTPVAATAASRCEHHAA
jgi:hypothetical protein